MFRIDDPTASASLPTPETAGTPGYFTEGDPGSNVPATNVRASFLNMLQEELCNAVTAGGGTLSKTTYTQLRDAIKALALGQFMNSYVGNAGWVRLPNGFIIQFDQPTFSAATGNITFPTAFPSLCAAIVVADAGSAQTFQGVAGSVTKTGATTLTFAGNPATFNYIAIGY